MTASTSNMASLKYLIATTVALCGLSRASACSCMPPGTLCDTIQDSDVVVRVKALSSVEGADINDDVVYTLETLEVFKAEEPGPNEYDEIGATFEMTTAGNSALCGVYMQMDGSTEYVLDMNRNNDGELYAAGICNLFQEWDEADRAEFEAGCDDYDPCNGTCSESQECLRSSGFYSEIEYYCSDTCEPNPCPEGTACTLDYPPCDGDFCVAEAICGGETMSPSTSPPIFTEPPRAVPDVAPDSPEDGDDGGIDETTSPSPAPQRGVTFAPTAVGDDDFSALTLNPAPADSPSSSPSLAPSGDGSRGTGLATTSSPSVAMDSGVGDDGAPSVPADTASPTTNAEAGGTGDTDAAAAQGPRLPGGGGLVASMAAAAAGAVAVAGAAAASCSAL